MISETFVSEASRSVLGDQPAENVVLGQETGDLALCSGHDEAPHASL
jgi:hypothetical protein